MKSAINLKGYHFTIHSGKYNYLLLHQKDNKVVTPLVFKDKQQLRNAWLKLIDDSNTLSMAIFNEEIKSLFYLQ